MFSEVFHEEKSDGLNDRPKTCPQGKGILKKTYTLLLLVNKNTFYIIQVAMAKAVMNTIKILPPTTNKIKLN